MCGRFTLKTPATGLTEIFVVSSFPPLSPRFNIAPTQLVVCIREATDKNARREAVLLKWGLIPFWAKEASIGSQMVNARSETAAEKPAFRKAFQSRRCIIPTDGFYEWEKMSGRTGQPWFIHMYDDTTFAFAGLWELWKVPGSDETIESCTILTTEANCDLQDVHERMPVILSVEQQAAWLSDSTSAGQLKNLMQPLPDGFLVRHPVASLVNKVANDQVECMKPVSISEPVNQSTKPRRQRNLFD